jgi:hypothetical protein
VSVDEVLWVYDCSLLETANKVLAEELDKAIDEKIGKFWTDKKVAEELGALGLV